MNVLVQSPPKTSRISCQSFDILPHIYCHPVCVVIKPRKIKHRHQNNKLLRLNKIIKGLKLKNITSN